MDDHSFRLGDHRRYAVQSDMKKFCELSKRPSLLTTVAGPFFLGIMFLFFMVVLNQVVASTWLNGWFVLTAIIFIVATFLLLLNLQVQISVENAGKNYRMQRKIMLLGWVVAARSIKVDDVFWKEHSDVESNGVRYEIYGRVREENGKLDAMRDISALGVLSVLVTLTRSEVESFRGDFQNI